MDSSAISIYLVYLTMEDCPESIATAENMESDSGHLLKLLEDSEKRYQLVNSTLEGTKMRNRQLSISLTKEKEERLKTKMALNVANEKADANRISLNRNLEKVCQLQNDVEELTQEKNELLELLESEKEKSKLLQSELELQNTTETSSKPGVPTDDTVDLTKLDEIESENFLQNIVMCLKKQLDTKATECNELEDKLSEMRQELVHQGEQLTRAGSEFEQQLNTLHDVLTKERQLNTLLSEESDQAVRELQIKLQEKDELNTELQGVHDQTSERIACIEEQCRFYRNKLKETEERLNVIFKEYESSVKGKASVSCQVCECELAPLGERRPASPPNEKVYQIMEEWTKGNIPKEQMGNSMRHRMNIVCLIQNGFKHLSGKTTV